MSVNSYLQTLGHFQSDSFHMEPKGQSTMGRTVGTHDVHPLMSTYQATESVQTVHMGHTTQIHIHRPYGVRQHKVNIHGPHVTPHEVHTHSVHMGSGHTKSIHTVSPCVTLYKVCIHSPHKVRPHKVCSHNPHGFRPHDVHTCHMTMPTVSPHGVN